MSDPTRRVRTTAVILNYQTPAATVTAARSVMASQRAAEVIVVDNHSADGSADVIRRELPDIPVHETDRNLGFSGGMNAGIREALRGGAELIFLANSDLLVDPDCIGLLERALDADPAAAIAGPLLVSAEPPNRIESAGVTFSRRTGRMRNVAAGQASNLARGTRPVDAVTGAAMLVRASVFRTVGLLDERYFFSYEDVEFCLRAAREGFKTVCVGSATAQHAGGLTIGEHSARRLYFGLRNQLLICRAPAARIPAALVPLRAAAVIAFNLAYAGRRHDIPALERLAALARALRDHWGGRYGPG